jgi:hypothetical protein
VVVGVVGVSGGPPVWSEVWCKVLPKDWSNLLHFDLLVIDFIYWLILTFFIVTVIEIIFKHKNKAIIVLTNFIKTLKARHDKYNIFLVLTFDMKQLDYFTNSTWLLLASAVMRSSSPCCSLLSEFQYFVQKWRVHILLQIIQYFQ